MVSTCLLYTSLLGVTDKAGFSDEKGRFPKMKQALYVDSVSAVVDVYKRQRVIFSPSRCLRMR